MVTENGINFAEVMSIFCPKNANQMSAKTETI